MLFLFVLMFYNQKITTEIDCEFGESLIFLVIFYIVLNFFLFYFEYSDDFFFEEYIINNENMVLLENIDLYNLFFFTSEIKKFSVVLFNYYNYEFICIGLLLLIIMLGLISILLNFYEYSVFYNENKKKNKIV